MQFQIESALSTTTTDSQELRVDEQQQSTTNPITSFAVQESSSILSNSAKRKQPRLAVSAAREKNNTQVRSRMQEARVLLGQEFYGNTPKTLASVRLSRGYSQQQVATAIGTSQPAIAKLEAGSVNILWSTGTRLAKALGLTLAEFHAVLTSTSKLASAPETSKNERS